jgi:hypothetical protein
MKTNYTFLMLGLITLGTVAQNRNYPGAENKFKLIDESQITETGGLPTSLQTLAKSSATVCVYDSVQYKQWDSTMNSWRHYASSVYSYDAHYNLSSYTTTINNGMLTISRTMFSFDNNKNLTNQLDQNYGNGNWVNTYQRVYTYDANNNRTSDLFQHWSGSAWINGNKTSHTYDANNNNTGILVQGWDGTTFNNMSQTLHTYTNNLLLTSQWQTWNNSLWNNSSRVTNFYSGTNVTSKITEVWNNNAWVNHQRVLDTYNGSNELTTRITQSWDGAIWKDQQKESFTYDVNNNVSSVLLQFKEVTGWKDNIRWTYTYNNNKNQTYYFEERWSGTNWIAWSEADNAYCGDGFCTQTSAYKQIQNGSLQNTLMLEYFGCSRVTDVASKGTDNGQITIFPNPNSGIFSLMVQNLKLEQIQVTVYNLLGQAVHQQKITEEKSEINLSIHESGVYQVQINSSSENKTYKVIIAK